ncbi:hypothetical protein R80B4_00078 [Fibrobacteres bacterium R8-0-B4]
MRTAYADYVELHGEWGELIEKTADNLKDRAKVFYDSKILDVNVSDIIYPPNEILIDDVVLNALADIDRIKGFHPVEKPKFYKYAAYIGFWWQRGKPLLCKAHDYKCLEKILKKIEFAVIIDICNSVNEEFIADVMLDIIQIPPTGGSSLCIKTHSDSKLVSYTDIRDSLSYFLRYRHYSAQELEIFLKGLNVCPFSVADGSVV